MSTDTWADTENRIRRSVWTLIAARDVKVEDVADGTGIPQYIVRRGTRDAVDRVCG